MKVRFFVTFTTFSLWRFGLFICYIHSIFAVNVSFFTSFWILFIFTVFCSEVSYVKPWSHAVSWKQLGLTWTYIYIYIHTHTSNKEFRKRIWLKIWNCGVFIFRFRKFENAFRKLWKTTKISCLIYIEDRKWEIFFFLKTFENWVKQMHFLNFLFNFFFEKLENFPHVSDFFSFRTGHCKPSYSPTAQATATSTNLGYAAQAWSSLPEPSQ